MWFCASIFSHSLRQLWSLFQPFALSIFKFKSAKRTSNIIESRCLNKKKLNLLKTKIKIYFNLKKFSQFSNVNSFWLIIKSGLIFCLDEIAPIKSFATRNIAHAPWYDDECVLCGLKRERLHNKNLCSRSAEDKLEFNRFRNHFRTMVRTKRANYHRNMISTESTSSSKLWKKLNPFINPNKRSMIDHLLFSSNNPMFTAQDMLNMFSNFFSLILNNITFCSIVKSTDYINQHLSTQKFASKLENISPFSFNEISIEKVSKSLLELDENSSAGSIGINTIVFKHCREEPFFLRLLKRSKTS